MVVSDVRMFGSHGRLMSNSWNLRVYEDNKLVYEDEFEGTAQVGRQRNIVEREPYWKSREDNNVWRVIVAKVDEINVSRRHVQIEPISPGWLKVTNLSKTQEIYFIDGKKIDPNSSLKVMLPSTLIVGGKTIRLEKGNGTGQEMHSVSLASLASRSPTPFASLLTSARSSSGLGFNAEDFILWIQATIEVLQSATNSLEFFARAAKAVVDLAGLDSGRVMLLEGGKWKVQAAEFAKSTIRDPEWQPSRAVLNKVLQEKKTVWQVPSGANLSESLQNVRSVVAAPILDAKGDVIGALYGVSDSLTSRPITRLEALLVEVLASGVATGLARLEQQREAIKARVQFEQFFTPELSRQLFDHPELLEGRDCEVSILFCDIKGFSRITERLGPTKTVKLINHILGVLSECVLKSGGVLVDYIGDELMAMWGAPENQPDHAIRACRAALAMLDHLPALNECCQPVMQEPLQLSIGISTGQARVGNVGSSFKFKYGALGNTVNMASRVQGVNKFLKTRVLVSEATKSQLDATFVMRQMCQVRVVNIDEPVTLFELVENEPAPKWLELKQSYEEALDRFQHGEFRLAARILGRLLSDHPQDGPSLVLISRTISYLADEREKFDPVWELPAK